MVNLIGSSFPGTINSNVSPTFSLFFISITVFSPSTFKTFSCGRSSEKYSSITRFPATLSATFLESPVSITILFTPTFFNSSTAYFDSSFSTSEITMCPEYSPSIAIWIIVPVLWHSEKPIEYLFINFEFPARIFFPSTTAQTPSPLISSILEIRFLSISFP